MGQTPSFRGIQGSTLRRRHIPTHQRGWPRSDKKSRCWVQKREACLVCVLRVPENGSPATKPLLLKPCAAARWRSHAFFTSLTKKVLHTSLLRTKCCFFPLFSSFFPSPRPWLLHIHRKAALMHRAPHHGMPNVENFTFTWVLQLSLCVLLLPLLRSLGEKEPLFGSLHSDVLLVFPHVCEKFNAAVEVVFQI